MKVKVLLLVILLALVHHSSQCTEWTTRWFRTPAYNLGDGVIQLCYNETWHNIDYNSWSNSPVSQLRFSTCRPGHRGTIFQQQCSSYCTNYNTVHLSDCPSSHFSNCNVTNSDVNQVIGLSCPTEVTAPISVNPIALDQHSVRVTWVYRQYPNFSRNIEHFRVACTTQNILVIIANTTMSYTISGFNQPYTHYNCRISSVAFNGEQSQQISFSGHTKPEIPPRPQNLNHYNLQSRTVYLRWDQTLNNSYAPNLVNYDVSCIPGVNINRCRSPPCYLSQLEPYRQYNCSVRARNYVGPSQYSYTSFRTNPVPPSSPQNVEISQVQARNATVSWSPPQYTNGSIQYNWCCSEAQCDPMNVSNNQRERVTSLRPYTYYSCCINANNSAGIGTSSCSGFRTSQAAPGRPPTNVTLVETTSTSLYLQWDKPEMEYRNGEITGYTVQLQHNGTPNNHNVHNTSINITNLIPYHRYEYAIAAYTSVGTGPMTNFSLAKTDEDVPSGIPENVSGRFVFFNSFQLEWSPPSEEKRNGIITEYTLELTKGDGSTETLSTTTTYTTHTFTGLQQGTYYCTIAARTKVGTGPGSRVKATNNFPAIGWSVGVIIIVLMSVVLFTSVGVLCSRRKSGKYNLRSQQNSSKQTDQKQQKSKAKKKGNQWNGLVLAHLPTMVNFEYEKQEDTQSITSSISNPTVPELPTRNYLDDTEFAHSLQVEPSTTQETSFCNQSIGSNDTVLELPARKYLDDDEFARSLQVEPSTTKETSLCNQSIGSNEIVLELPARKYLDDDEFARSLQVDPPSFNEDSKQHSSDDEETESEDDSPIRGKKETKKGPKISASTLERQYKVGYKKDRQDGGLSLQNLYENKTCSLEGKKDSTLPEQKGQEEKGQEVSEKEGKTSSEGVYMSLCAATMEKADPEGSGSGLGEEASKSNDDSNGHYMALDASTRERYIKPWDWAK